MIIANPDWCTISVQWTTTIVQKELITPQYHIIASCSEGLHKGIKESKPHRDNRGDESLSSSYDRNVTIGFTTCTHGDLWSDFCRRERVPRRAHAALQTERAGVGLILLGAPPLPLLGYHDLYPSNWNWVNGHTTANLECSTAMWLLSNCTCICIGRFGSSACTCCWRRSWNASRCIILMKTTRKRCLLLSIISFLGISWY